MGVPSSEVGYTAAIPRREDHEVHKDLWWHWTIYIYTLSYALIQDSCGLICLNIPKNILYIYIYKYIIINICSSEYLNRWDNMSLELKRRIILELFPNKSNVRSWFRLNWLREIMSRVRLLWKRQLTLVELVRTFRTLYDTSSFCAGFTSTDPGQLKPIHFLTFSSIYSPLPRIRNLHIPLTFPTKRWKISIFWDVTPCIEYTGLSKTLAPNYKTTDCHKAEHWSYHTHRPSNSSILID